MPRASLAPPLVPPFRHISVSMAGIWGSRSSAVLQLKMANSHCFEAVHLYIPSCTAVHCPCEMLLWDDMTITILISYIMHVFLAPEACSHISLSITFLFLISCGILADALLHLNIQELYHSFTPLFYRTWIVPLTCCLDTEGRALPVPALHNYG